MTLLRRIVRFLGSREGADEVARLDIPHSHVVPLIFRREVLRPLQRAFWDDYGIVGPGNEIILARRKVQEFYKGMREALLGFPRRSAPETHTLTVQCNEVGPYGRPRNIKICPIRLRMFVGNLAL